MKFCLIILLSFVSCSIEGSFDYCDYSKDLFDSTNNYLKSMCWIVTSSDYQTAESYCKMLNMALFSITSLSESAAFMDACNDKLGDDPDIAVWINGKQMKDGQWMCDNKTLLVSIWPTTIFNESAKFLSYANDDDGTFVTSEAAGNESFTFMCEFINPNPVLTRSSDTTASTNSADSTTASSSISSDSTTASSSSVSTTSSATSTTSTSSTESSTTSTESSTSTDPEIIATESTTTETLETSTSTASEIISTESTTTSSTAECPRCLLGLNGLIGTIANCAATFGVKVTQQGKCSTGKIVECNGVVANVGALAGNKKCCCI